MTLIVRGSHRMQMVPANGTYPWCGASALSRIVADSQGDRINFPFRFGLISRSAVNTFIYLCMKDWESLL